MCNFSDQFVFGYLLTNFNRWDNILLLLRSNMIIMMKYNNASTKKGTGAGPALRVRCFSIWEAAWHRLVQ